MLEGEISQIDVVARLVELWREGFTGAIRFENDGIIKIIYFKTGDVLSASTNDRADSIDEILMKAGKVGREHVKQALAKRKETETLGDALLNLGFITRKELTWARRVQVIGVIRSIAAWATGSFTIVADYLPKREEGTLFPLPQIIVELIVTDQDRGKFERQLEGGNLVYTKSAEFDDLFRRLGLNEEAERITREIDGNRTAGDVATASGKDAFNAYKLLHALEVLGLIRRAEAKPQVTTEVPLDDLGFAGLGVADASDAWGDLGTPAPASGGVSFELDDAPPPPSVTMPVPPIVMPERTVEIPAEEIAEPMGFEPDPEPTLAMPSMPAWDERPIAPPAPASTPAPPPITPMPVLKQEEPAWGFDEAQIETARRAAVPVRGTEPKKVTVERAKPRRTYGLIVSLLALAIIALGGWYAWMWWQNRQAEEAAAQVVTRPARPRPRPVIPAPAATGTIVEATETMSTATGTQPVTGTTAMTASTPVATTTVAAATPPPAPAPRPMVITPPPSTSTTRVERTDTGGAVITNSGAPSPQKARYDSMARDFLARGGEGFTVQFEIVCEPSNVKKALDAGGDNVWFVPISFRGKSCYRVFWGRYASREAAMKGAGEIPAGLRSGTPAVVSIPKG